MDDQLLDKDILTQTMATDSQNLWAGFWIRVGATFIDYLVYLPVIVLYLYNLNKLKSFPLHLFIFLILIVYKPFMEFKYGATLGKMAVKIKVVNTDFNKISLEQSILRYIPWLIGQVISIYATILVFQLPDFKTAMNITAVGHLQDEILPRGITLLSEFVLFISCIVVAFSRKKQGLHDMIASTYCIHKNHDLDR